MDSFKASFTYLVLRESAMILKYNNAISQGVHVFLQLLPDFVSNVLIS